jgi:hypothetical protein
MRLSVGAVQGVARPTLILAGLLAFTVGGCGGKKVGTISGVVTYQDKPLPGGYVNFNVLGPDGKVLDSKSTDIEDNGSYKIAGVLTGPAKITVQGPAGEITQAKTAGGMPFRGKPAVVLPPRYGSVEQTDLNYTVTAGPQTHNIELK